MPIPQESGVFAKALRTHQQRQEQPQKTPRTPSVGFWSAIAGAMAGLGLAYLIYAVVVFLAQGQTVAR